MNELSKADANDTLDLISTFFSSTGELSLEAGIAQLQKLISFDASNLTFIDINNFIVNPDKHKYQFNYRVPKTFRDMYFEKAYYKIDVQVQAFLKTHKLYNYSDALMEFNNNEPTILDIESSAWKFPDGWIHGICDYRGINKYIIANFFGDKIENNHRTKTILNYIVPHLCVSYQRILKETKNKKSTLTKRELEMIQWLKDGKTSWEISQILCISERSVIFHVENLKKKLDAVNRTQAVAIAISEGIISL